MDIKSNYIDLLSDLSKVKGVGKKTSGLLKKKKITFFSFYRILSSILDILCHFLNILAKFEFRFSLMRMAKSVKRCRKLKHSFSFSSKKVRLFFIDFPPKLSTWVKKDQSCISSCVGMCRMKNFRILG